MTTSIVAQINFIKSRYVLSQETNFLFSSKACVFWTWGEGAVLPGQDWNNSFLEKPVLAVEMTGNGDKVVFVFFRGLEKFFRIENGNLNGLRMFQDGSEIVSVMLEVSRGYVIVSSSGYESEVFSNATRTFFLDGRKVQSMVKFRRKTQNLFANPSPQFFNPNVAQILPPGMKWTPPVPREDYVDQNLFLVSEGREVFGKDMEMISFFGQHCIVTRQGLSNVYSIVDGFKSPVWFNEVHAINENGYEVSISKKAERVFLVLGKKYIWVERNSPFSLFNSGDFNDKKRRNNN